MTGLERREKALVTIREKFEAQGGTGFQSMLDHEGYKCAAGVLLSDDYFEGRREVGFMRELCGMGFLSSEIDGLMDSHDQAIEELVRAGATGLESRGSWQRALFGTPAYDAVMKQIGVWVVTGRYS